MQIPCPDYPASNVRRMVPKDEIAFVNTVSTSDPASLSSYSTEGLQTAQSEDSGIALILSSNTQPPSTPSDSKDRWLLQLWDQLTVIDGLLYRTFFEPRVIGSGCSW